MVCTSSDILGWKDFPKGLRVLLLGEDGDSAAEMRSRLEQMDYVVSTFCDENEALAAISNKSESFHIAILEISSGNCNAVFKFLERVKDLPTILTSGIYCLTTMMKCIALGAVEFLQKPLSDDKLRNIWQHVLHKAFNAGEQDVPESIKPVKESVVSMLQLKAENGEANRQTDVKAENLTPVQDNNYEASPSDRYPAPSTPQLRQGLRLMDDVDCLDLINFSAEVEAGEHEGESKFVEISSDLVAYTSGSAKTDQRHEEAVIKEEHESANGCKSGTDTSHSQNTDNPGRISNDSINLTDPSKSSERVTTNGSKVNRKKIKVDWTPELHKKFVKAVEQLGVDQAIPSRILELMKVEGLTRHNVASHLQKYRMHRRQILPKEEERRWPHPRDPTQRSYYSQKPVTALPPYHSNPPVPASQVYPAWAPPGGYQNAVQTWGPPYFTGWHSTESWHWRPHPVMHADAWGCPMMPPPLGSCPPFPQVTTFPQMQNPPGFYVADEMQNRNNMLNKSFDKYPEEEVIDKVVKEAINKPWLPLPLGLKPPSTDSVLTELSKKGISTIPPHLKGSHKR